MPSSISNTSLSQFLADEAEIEGAELQDDEEVEVELDEADIEVPSKKSGLTTGGVMTGSGGASKKEGSVGSKSGLVQQGTLICLKYGIILFIYCADEEDSSAGEVVSVSNGKKGSKTDTDKPLQENK